MDSPKKIAIIAHALKAGGGISVGQNFSIQMKKIFPNSNFLITVPSDLNYIENIKKDRTKFEVFKQENYIQQWFYENSIVPRLINTWGADIVISLGNRALKNITAKQLLLIHDSHLFYPTKYFASESFKRKLLKFFQRIKMKRDLKKIDGLLLQTKTAEIRVRDYYNYHKNITILPNAVSIKVDSKQSIFPCAFEKYKRNFRVLYLARYYPHKNIEILIDMFDMYADELEDIVLFLTIREDQGVGAKVIIDRISKNKFKNKIINIGPIEQEEIASYLGNADVLMMPTTLESFSGTYLEAMHLNVPILTSDLDFAHEICGGAAFYFDPWNVESAKDSLLKIKYDTVLKNKLILSGQDQLKSLQFDWDSNGKIIKDCINNV